MEVIVTIVSKLVDFTYLRDVNKLYRGEITQLHPVPAGHPRIPWAFCQFFALPGPGSNPFIAMSDLVADGPDGR